jgi:peroxiredoxin
VEPVTRPPTTNRGVGSWKRWLAVVVGAAALLAVAVFATRGQSGAVGQATIVAAGHAQVGHDAPDFSTPLLNGGTVRLSALRGKVVLINFWATWCTACQDEMPAIEQVWDRYRGRGLAVIAVDFREGNKAAMQRFLSQVGAKFTAALDPDGKIADAYGVTFGLPTSVFVDRDGVVRVIHLGQMAPDFIDQQALSLL